MPKSLWMLGRPKEKVYKSNLKNFWVLCGIASPFMLILLVMGKQNLRFFPVEAQDPAMRFLFGYLPLIVAGCGVAGLLYMFLVNVNRRIGVHPIYFLYKSGAKEVQIRWEEVLFTPPRPDKKPLFPTAMVSDGSNFVRFEKFFFPEFEEICTIVANTKKAVKGEGLVI